MTTLTRRTVLSSILASALPLTMARAQDAALDQPLNTLYQGLQAAMRAGRQTPFTQRFDALAPAVDGAFDLTTILKVSVGLRWDSMPAAQQQALLTTFRRFTIATYVANFDKFDGERFQVDPGARDSGSDKVVKTQIVPQSGDTIRLDYVMRQTGSQWKAVDVLLDGSISRVAVQRSDFRKLLGNGDPDNLINSLKKKISDLSDGALSS